MPLETMSADSTELVSYLVSALWIVTGLCAIVVTFALGLFFLVARTAKQAKTTLPELHQFGRAKDAGESRSNEGLNVAPAQ